MPENKLTQLAIPNRIPPSDSKSDEKLIFQIMSDLKSEYKFGLDYMTMSIFDQFLTIFK